MEEQAAITFTRSILEHTKLSNGQTHTRRTPYYNNLSLVVEGGRAYIIGNRGRKYITVKASCKGANRVLVGLRGKYTVVVGSIVSGGLEGLEALERFIRTPKNLWGIGDETIMEYLEMIVFQIARNAEIDEPDIYR